MIGHPLGEQMVDGNEYGVSDSDYRSTFVPARAIRRNWAARYVLFVRAAALATSTSVRRSQAVPRRVRPLMRRSLKAIDEAAP